MAIQRQKRLRGQKEIWKHKQVCTKKRQIGTAHHVEAHIPKKLYALPNHYTDLLVNAISAGRERAKQVLAQKTLVRPSDFLEEQTFFSDISSGNPALFHLLMATFLINVGLTMKYLINKIKMPSTIQLSNRYLTSALSQREFSISCLFMKSNCVAEIPAIARKIKMNGDLWRSYFFGALGVARVAHALLFEGARVLFPSPLEDARLKIDLIATFKGQSEGLCVQVKTSIHTQIMECRAHKKRLRTRDFVIIDQFLHGVRSFQKRYRGIWIPVEITLGPDAYQVGDVNQRGVIRQVFCSFLQSVLDEFHPSHHSNQG